jgi:hypothetical protein
MNGQPPAPGWEGDSGSSYIMMSVRAASYFLSLQENTHNQPFRSSIRNPTATVSQSLTMSIAPPSLEFILHDGETGEVSKLPIDCSAFHLQPQHSIETNLEDDEFGTLQIKHSLDNHCFDSFTQIIGPNSWLEVSVKGQESQIVIPGGHADFEQTESGLEYVEGYPGDADTVIAFRPEQQERYEKQKEEYTRQVDESTHMLEAYEKRVKAAGQNPKCDTSA